MKLGFVTAILPDLELEEVVEFAASEGFGCIEVMCWPAASGDTRRYAGVSHIDVDGFSDDDASSGALDFRWFAASVPHQGCASC